jgi:hypothetical protein
MALSHPDIPVYVIEKRIPEEWAGMQFTSIEAMAAKGLKKLTNILRKDKALNSPLL